MLKNRLLKNIDSALREGTVRISENVFDQVIDSFLKQSEHNFDQMQDVMKWKISKFLQKTLTTKLFPYQNPLVFLKLNDNEQKPRTIATLSIKINSIVGLQYDPHNRNYSIGIVKCIINENSYYSDKFSLIDSHVNLKFSFPKIELTSLDYDIILHFLVSDSEDVNLDISRFHLLGRVIVPINSILLNSECNNESKDMDILDNFSYSKCKFCATEDAEQFHISKPFESTLSTAMSPAAQKEVVQYQPDITSSSKNRFRQFITNNKRKNKQNPDNISLYSKNINQFLSGSETNIPSVAGSELRSHKRSSKKNKTSCTLHGWFSLFPFNENSGNYKYLCALGGFAKIGLTNNKLFIAAANIKFTVRHSANSMMLALKSNIPRPSTYWSIPLSLDIYQLQCFGLSNHNSLFQLPMWLSSIQIFRQYMLFSDPDSNVKQSEEYELFYCLGFWTLCVLSLLNKRIYFMPLIIVCLIFYLNIPYRKKYSGYLKYYRPHNCYCAAAFSPDLIASDPGKSESNSDLVKNVPNTSSLARTTNRFRQSVKLPQLFLNKKCNRTLLAMTGRLRKPVLSSNNEVNYSDKMLLVGNVAEDFNKWQHLNSFSFKNDETNVDEKFESEFDKACDLSGGLSASKATLSTDDSQVYEYQTIETVTDKSDDRLSADDASLESKFESYIPSLLIGDEAASRYSTVATPFGEQQFSVNYLGRSYPIFYDELGYTKVYQYWHFSVIILEAAQFLLGLIATVLSRITNCLCWIDPVITRVTLVILLVAALQSCALLYIISTFISPVRLLTFLSILSLLVISLITDPVYLKKSGILCMILDVIQEYSINNNLSHLSKRICIDFVDVFYLAKLLTYDERLTYLNLIRSKDKDGIKVNKVEITPLNLVPLNFSVFNRSRFTKNQYLKSIISEINKIVNPVIHSIKKIVSFEFSYVFNCLLRSMDYRELVHREICQQQWLGSSLSDLVDTEINPLKFVELQVSQLETDSVDFIYADSRVYAKPSA